MKYPLTILLAYSTPPSEREESKLAKEKVSPFRPLKRVQAISVVQCEK